MKNNSILKHILFSAIGIIIFVAGIILVKLISDESEFLRSLPYIAIGVGTGLFGDNLGSVINLLILKKNPQAAINLEIEENDERNIAIRNKAKAKAFDLMLFVFGGLMLSFSLMQADMVLTLSLVACYLFIVFSHIYYLCKFQKEM